jgi:hypothetical protein
MKREDRQFNLSFPIPIYIFDELLDCISDLLEFACFFAPQQNIYSSFSVQNIKTLTLGSMNLFDSLSEDEPYNLADVKSNNIKISIIVK